MYELAALLTTLLVSGLILADPCDVRLRRESTGAVTRIDTTGGVFSIIESGRTTGWSAFYQHQSKWFAASAAGQPGDLEHSQLDQLNRMLAVPLDGLSFSTEAGRPQLSATSGLCLSFRSTERGIVCRPGSLEEAALLSIGEHIPLGYSQSVVTLVDRSCQEISTLPLERTSSEVQSLVAGLLRDGCLAPDTSLKPWAPPRATQPVQYPMSAYSAPFHTQYPAYAAHTYQGIPGPQWHAYLPPYGP